MVCIDREISSEKLEDKSMAQSSNIISFATSMETCMELLLQGSENMPKADPNVENEAKGETLLFHAIINNKNATAKILFKHGAKFFDKGSNKMTCLVGCIKSANIVFL